MPAVVDVRRFFAEEIAAVANLQSRALVEAFAAVPREEFLGPGPWMIAYPDQTRPGRVLYRTTEDADPRRIYHNVLVAIDPARELNNGHPSSLAMWIDALQLREGARVFHVGCGVGYYTAVIAHVVGPTGQVVALEVDATLAARARDQLARYPWVEVVAGDGTAYDPGPVDAVLANAGLTHPPDQWLDRLVPDGRMLMPLTTFTGAPAGSVGFMLLVARVASGFAASFVSPVAIFASVAGRDPDLNERLRAALGSGRWQAVRRLRRDDHVPAESCWLHGERFCLSTDLG